MKNREILFRGKSILSGEWVEGSLVITEHNQYILPMHDETIEVIGSEPVHSDTIGQFTGLLDKNGKRIFEGDIVIFLAITCNFLPAGYCQKPYEKNQKFVVTNLISGFSLTIPEILHSKIPNQVGHVDNYTFWNNQTSFEVIGNIHDTQIK